MVYFKIKQTKMEKFSDYLKIDELKDAENPEYMFNMTHTKLLVGIVKGKIDCVKLAKEELDNRLLDMNGKPQKK